MPYKNPVLYRQCSSGDLMNYINPRYKESLSLWDRAKLSLVPGSSTISKRADLYPFGAYPIYLQESQGARVLDIDGHQYIDFQSALGAVLLGHNHPTVKKAMAEQLELGTLFSLSNPLLIDLAEKIQHHIPCAERVRVLKNGSDATTGAVRIARAYTKKDKILACHYHGWHDWYYVSTTMNAGIPQGLKENIISFPYNDIEQFAQLLKRHSGEIAAVIMEPTHLNEPNEGYLNQIKTLTHEAGALLIFDEVVTGFRFGLGGAQSYFGVTPDLACFAKALGNGAPISLIAGKRNIMDATQQVVTTQTYGEDCLAISAALATLAVMEQEPVTDRLWSLGALLQEGYNCLAKRYGIDSECVGYPIRMQIEFKPRGQVSAQLLKSFLLQETAKDGFLIAHMIFINYSHTEEQVRELLLSIEKVFQIISSQPEAIQLNGTLAVDLW